MTAFLVSLAVSGVVAFVVAYPAARWALSRHRHGPWFIVGGHYMPPVADSFRVKGAGLDYVEDLLYGYTNLTERCGDPKCSLIRTRRVRGRVDVTIEARPS